MQSSVNQKESRTFFGHPYPLGSLFFTEMWERFSFYGIRPLLILFMAATVYDGGMGLARENASAIVGIFAGTMYLAAGGDTDRSAGHCHHAGALPALHPSPGRGCPGYREG